MNFFVIGLLFHVAVSAKHSKTDSLWNVLKTAKEDTNKISALDNLSRRLISSGGFHKADSLAHEEIKLAEKLGLKSWEASAYNTLGLINDDQGNYPPALEMYGKSLKLREELGLKKEMAGTINNIGGVYLDQGDYAKALEQHYKALKIREEIGDKKGMSFSLGNLAIVYNRQGSFVKALDCALKALKIQEELKDNRSISISLVNIGNIYDGQKDYDKALDSYLKALKIKLELGDKYGAGTCYGDIALQYETKKKYKEALDYDIKAKNIMVEFADSSSIARIMKTMGTIYSDMNEYEPAIQYNDTALRIFEKIGDSSGIASAYIDIGAIDLQFKKYTNVADNLLKGLAIAKKSGDLKMQEDAYDGLREVYEKTGDKAKALDYYKAYYAVRDSLYNKENTKKLVQEEMNYDFDKKQAAEKAEQDKKDALTAEAAKRQKIIIYAVTLGLLLALLLAISIYRSLKQNKKKTLIIKAQKEEVEQQKAIIEHQKEMVEEKNKDILDSITYAKRLQDAILPPLNLVKQYIPDSFLFYKPKDIVAGDFYWMERAGDNVLIAAADCTGHGVPGALVSVVCSNALNRTVKEFRITEPGKILDKVRELVLETFEKSEGNIQDGMDISLCCINTKIKEAQWSGAYNSLWYVHNHEVLEVAADKQPIGKTDKPMPFNTHNLKLEKGDILYLFTDGYADQFGGPKGKKFKYKQMQDLLLSNAAKTMEQQRSILESTLNNWMGNMEQIDDVLVIGIRI